MINNNSSYYFEMISTHIKSILSYLHKNAWTIVFLIVGGYICFDQFIDPLLHKYRTSKSYKEATNPDRVAVLNSDMKRIRAHQQQVTIERSLQAAHDEKEKLKKEKERKRIKTPEEERWEKLGGEGNKLGDDNNDSRSNTAVDGDGLRRRRR